MHPTFQRQSGWDVAQRGSVSKFQVCPGKKELGTVFFDILRSRHWASCSGAQGLVSDVSEAVRQACTSLTPCLWNAGNTLLRTAASLVWVSWSQRPAIVPGACRLQSRDNRRREAPRGLMQTRSSLPRAGNIPAGGTAPIPSTRFLSASGTAMNLWPTSPKHSLQQLC